MPKTTKPTKPTERATGATGVPMRHIRKYARAIAERFAPDKIILFGSHAYGTPNSDSDVDLLVVMPCRDRITQAVNIRWEFPAPFSLDLIVRTPRQMADRLAMGDSFMTEIVTEGKVLYEAPDTPLGSEGGGRLARRIVVGRKRPRAL